MTEMVKGAECPTTTLGGAKVICRVRESGGADWTGRPGSWSRVKTFGNYVGVKQGRSLIHSAGMDPHRTLKIAARRPWSFVSVNSTLQHSAEGRPSRKAESVFPFQATPRTVVFWALNQDPQIAACRDSHPPPTGLSMGPWQICPVWFSILLPTSYPAGSWDPEGAESQPDSKEQWRISRVGDGENLLELLMMTNSRTSITTTALCEDRIKGVLKTCFYMRIPISLLEISFKIKMGRNGNQVNGG